jgi:hypothetical protein
MSKNVVVFENGGVLYLRYGGAALLGRRATAPERRTSRKKMKIIFCSLFFQKSEER